ncbi:Putative AhpC/TSA family protein (fragment) [Nitrosotalea sinensis]|jgi:peroxiredoxin Q/BCP|uniref:thioredoxin-dependent peroxiredoxin n=1 Tax=Nitrosotalea sinensis TaxID=1499975 RepID=A0A2H1EHH6_9ARCH
MNEGDSAPDFELAANDGTNVKLSSFLGKKNVVLCFYPKNHLFACPSKKVFEMAQATIAVYPKIKELGAELFAISIDTVPDQKKFVQEYDVPYLHLSDTAKTVCKAYAGLNIAGLAKRSTFVIGKDGKISKIFRDINPEKHGQEIISSLQNLP